MAANANLLFFVGLEPRELCALIAPPVHEDRETSVSSEAKSGVECCAVIPAVGAEPVWLTCARVCVSDALLALYF